jgi:hypothetical protein
VLKFKRNFRRQRVNSDYVWNMAQRWISFSLRSFTQLELKSSVYVAVYIVYILPEYMFEHGNLSNWSLVEDNLQIQNDSYLKYESDSLKISFIQGLSKRFERFKFSIFYLLIVKIRYNFTHKQCKCPSLFTNRNQLTNAQCERPSLYCKCQYDNLTPSLPPTPSPLHWQPFCN